MKKLLVVVMAACASLLAHGQMVNPGSQVRWPTTCTSGVYQPATNTCVATGTGSGIGGGNQSLQFNSAGSFSGDTKLTYNPSAQKMYIPDVAAKGPHVDVTNADFASGCAGVSGNPTGLADPTGAYDSTCAIEAAANYAQAEAVIATGTGIQTSGKNAPVLYFPSGNYHLSAMLKFTYAVSLQGDSAGGSTLVWTGNTPGIEYFSSSGNGGFFAHTFIRDLSIIGPGHLSQQDGLIIYGSDNFILDDLHVSNWGGNGINDLRGSERNVTNNVDVDYDRIGIRWEGDGNESYHYNTHCINPNQDFANYSYNVNAVNGVFPASGVLYPDPHACIMDLGNQNSHWLYGSIKSTEFAGGFKVENTTGAEINGFYIEGYNNNSLNYSVELGGHVEYSHTTAALAATTSASVAVDNAVYQWQYVSDNSLAAYMAANHNTDAAIGYCNILPPDYLRGSTAPSVLGNGILQDTLEPVGCVFTSDNNTTGAPSGTALLFNRGSPIAWPAGAVIGADTATGFTHVHDAHLNSVNQPDGNHTFGCNDSTIRTTGWMYNPDIVCAEAIDGFVADGFQIQEPTSNNSSSGVSQTGLTYGNIDGYTNSQGEIVGSGWVKTGLNASFTTDVMTSNPPPLNFSTANYTFPNGETPVQVINYGTSSSPLYGELHFSENFSSENSSSGYGFRQWIVDSFGGFGLSALQSIGGEVLQDVGPNTVPTFQFELEGWGNQYPGMRYCSSATAGSTTTQTCNYQILYNTGTGALNSTYIGNSSWSGTETHAGTASFQNINISGMINGNMNPIRQMLTIAGTSLSGTCTSGTVNNGAITSGSQVSITAIGAPPGNFIIYGSAAAGIAQVNVCGTGTFPSTSFNVLVQ